MHKDPSEFQECLEQELDHVHGRLHIEEAHSTWNFRDYLLKAGIKITGLTSTHVEPDACHVWQFARRGALLDASILCQHEDWVALEPQAPAHCHSAKLSKSIFGPSCTLPHHTTPIPSTHSIFSQTIPPSCQHANHPAGCRCYPQHPRVHAQPEAQPGSSAHDASPGGCVASIIHLGGVAFQPCGRE